MFFPIKLTPQQDASFPVVWHCVPQSFIEQYRNTIQQRLGASLESIAADGGIPLHDLAAAIDGNETRNDTFAIIVLEVALNKWEWDHPGEQVEGNVA